MQLSSVSRKDAHVVAIIQARMGSSRFPGKTLADLCGHPMLWHVVERVKRASAVHKVLVATSNSRADDSIAKFCSENATLCFRGSEEDVLDRYYRAAREHRADCIVRITADCPLIDSAVINAVIRRFLDGKWDYVSNTVTYTYPDGLDTEVFSFTALQKAWRRATQASDREHVTPFIRREGFSINSVENDKPMPPGVPTRWTVDHESDLDFVQRIYSTLACDASFESIVKLLQKDSKLNLEIVPRTCNEGYYRSLYREARAGSAPALKLESSNAWLERSLRVIPSAAQTFSKKRTQYVQGATPTFLQSGKGCRVTDVDGNTYIDYVQALLPNILGYAHSEVTAAAVGQLAHGHSFSLPHPLEVELAERLTRIIPCAEMVRFGKNGSDATAGAVRLSRAVTGRDHIACCGYHGWQDWYIGSTTRNAGVPESVRALTHPFRYNDLSSLERLFQKYPSKVAAVIMEPFNFEEPNAGFLESVRDLTHSNGAVLIFDEICSGFHFGLGGGQKQFGVTPDLACFGKAMANGFPISCVVGGADLMRSFDEIFFSFTFAGEVASMAAAMKVLDVLESTDALRRIASSGTTLQDGLNVMTAEAGLEDRIRCVGRPQWSLLKFLDTQGRDDIVLKNLFQQEVVKRGVLIQATHNMTAAHDTSAIQHTLNAYARAIKSIAEWLTDPNPARFLEGSMSQPVFKVR
ncbi:MAG TPA: aminotransferase class III-fold pyridoxal phosphate-dependent enzyme [Terriglobales bacterium]|nr:aminotransferase class III-fold pyridoxal phosphate-dependent enzyme [Terriglobales bacterium]